MRRPPVVSGPVRRAALFTLADARGNSPHATRETAYDEGRRLNAGRYETVGDLDRALDARSRPRQVVQQLAGPEQAADAPTGLLGLLALVAVGAGITYVLMRKDKDESDEDEDDEFVAPVAAPVAAPAPVVVPVPVPAPRRQRAPKVVVVPVSVPAPVTNPAPAPVHVTVEAPVAVPAPTPSANPTTPVAAFEKPKRRVRRAKT